VFKQSWLDVQAGIERTGFGSPAELARWCSASQEDDEGSWLSPRPVRGRPRPGWLNGRDHRATAENAKPA